MSVPSTPTSSALDAGRALNKNTRATQTSPLAAPEMAANVIREMVEVASVAVVIADEPVNPPPPYLELGPWEEDYSHLRVAEIKRIERWFKNYSAMISAGLETHTPDGLLFNSRSMATQLSHYNRRQEDPIIGDLTNHIGSLNVNDVDAGDA